MELPLDNNTELVFTLKLSKTFMKTVENSDHREAGELIILTKDANQCVGSIAIGNPTNPCSCQKDASKNVEPTNQAKVPRKRGRKRKSDIPMKPKFEETMNTPNAVLETDEAFRGEILDLSVKKTDQGLIPNGTANAKVNDMAMDLSIGSKKALRNINTSSKQPKSSFLANVNSSEVPKIIQRQEIITSTINGPETDFSSEIFQLISSLPNADSVPANPEATASTPAPKRKNNKKVAEPKQPKKGAAPKIYFCDFCTFSTPSKHIMKRHEISDHENARPFACTICEHRCKQKTNLKIHYMHKHKMLGSEAANLIIKQGMEKPEAQESMEQGSPISAASSPEGEKDHSEHEEKNDAGSGTESESNLKFLPSPQENLDEDQEKSDEDEKLGFSGINGHLTISL